MNWTLEDDHTLPIITAERHVKSDHGNSNTCELPETCVVFEIGMALKYIEKEYKTETLIEKLPCFLDSPKCLIIKGKPSVCFTRGGYGAPAAVDTLETLRALGVKRIIIVGMCGVFAEDVDVGDVIIPDRILCEEGTSHHYFENVEFAQPNSELFRKANTYFKSKFEIKTDATVTSDAVYRQTFAKEEFWRNKGCVGVDMESSALLLVSRYYSIPAVSILLASDKHPLNETEKKWEWGNKGFDEVRENFVKHSVQFSLDL